MNLKSINNISLVKTMNKLSLTKSINNLIKMMTDALIKVGRPDTSCARACHVG